MENQPANDNDENYMNAKVSTTSYKEDFIVRILALVQQKYIKKKTKFTQKIPKPVKKKRSIQLIIVEAMFL